MINGCHFTIMEERGGGRGRNEVEEGAQNMKTIIQIHVILYFRHFSHGLDLLFPRFKVTK